MKTTEQWLEYPQFLNNHLPWSLHFHIRSLLMYKELCPLKDSSCAVDAEGAHANLFMPCSGRVFSKEDKSMTAPSPFPCLSLIYYTQTTHAHKYMFRMPKRKILALLMGHCEMVHQQAKRQV